MEQFVLLEKIQICKVHIKKPNFCCDFCVTKKKHTKYRHFKIKSE